MVMYLKPIVKPARLSTFLLLVCCFSLFSLHAQKKEIEGAWHMQEDGMEHTLVMVDNYLSVSIFDLKNKQFVNTWGGPYILGANELKVDIQFNAQKNEEVQKQHLFQVQLKEILSTN